MKRMCIYTYYTYTYVFEVGAFKHEGLSSGMRILIGLNTLGMPAGKILHQRILGRVMTQTRALSLRVREFEGGKPRQKPHPLHSNRP